MTKKKTRRRTITPAEAERQRQAGQRIGPGVWLDRQGDPHFSIPEILAHLGLPDTPADRQIAAKVIAELLAKHCPDARIIQQDEGTDG